MQSPIIIYHAIGYLPLPLLFRGQEFLHPLPETKVTSIGFFENLLAAEALYVKALTVAAKACVVV